MPYKTRELGQRQHLEHSRCSSKFKGMTYTAFKSWRQLVQSCEKNWNGIRQMSDFASGWYSINGLGFGTQR